MGWCSSSRQVGSSTSARASATRCAVPRTLVDVRVRRQAQAIECRFDAVLDRPRVRGIELFVERMHAIDLARLSGGVVVDQELTRLTDPVGHGLEHRLPQLERRLLRDAGELEPGREPKLAVIGARAERDQLQQAGLARAVAAEEADMLARLDDEIRMIEQRDVAVGERDFGELEERHR